ncbi:hypothetical protein [Fulvimarina sp. MAC3]|uniref:hypothetical protein n=1 Tax=Fulvimarina sp. MAC3 TaxID=3148887 RepID=UPI0031FC5CF2
MMNFVATAAGAGIAAVVLVANLQGAPLPAETTRAGATLIDPRTTSSVPVPSVQQPASGMRMIDLRSGASCRIVNPDGLSEEFKAAPIGPDCQSSPAIGRVAKWRKMADGTLEMADDREQPVLRFMPGDGVLYESIYPSEALVTIVSANG